MGFFDQRAMGVAEVAVDDSCMRDGVGPSAAVRAPLSLDTRTGERSKLPWIRCRPSAAVRGPLSLDMPTGESRDSFPEQPIFWRSGVCGAVDVNSFQKGDGVDKKRGDRELVVLASRETPMAPCFSKERAREAWAT